MRQLKLRGNAVNIDDDEKIIYVIIKKPKGKVFSLSDQIVSFINRGYVAKVDVLGDVQTVSDVSKAFKKEVVPSKFPGYEPWHRYWFMMEKKEINEEPKQETFW